LDRLNDGETHDRLGDLFWPWVPSPIIIARSLRLTLYKGGGARNAGRQVGTGHWRRLDMSWPPAAYVIITLTRIPPRPGGCAGRASSKSHPFLHRG
jgi:hypothetical protein